MDEYIEREAVKKWLHQDEFGTPDERWRPESEFATMIEAVPSADVQEVKWISVDDRLPECETEVLIATKTSNGYKLFTTAIYEDGTMPEDESSWRWTDFEMEYDEENDRYLVPCGWWEYRHYGECLNYAVDDKVTHWMPLPEPPEMKDGE